MLEKFSGLGAVEGAGWVPPLAGTPGNYSQSPRRCLPPGDPAKEIPRRVDQEGQTRSPPALGSELRAWDAASPWRQEGLPLEPREPREPPSDRAVGRSGGASGAERGGPGVGRRERAGGGPGVGLADGTARRVERAARDAQRPAGLGVTLRGKLGAHTLGQT